MGKQLWNVPGESDPQLAAIRPLSSIFRLVTK
jgi:hypothetical protein